MGEEIMLSPVVWLQSFSLVLASRAYRVWFLEPT
jgi:hypothetical protein